MGQEISVQERFIEGLKDSLRACRVEVKKKDLVQFFEFLKDICPWLPQEGTIDEKRWKRVGDALNDFYKCFGPEKVPVTAFSYWNAINDILCVRHHPDNVRDILKEGESFLKRELERSHSSLEPGLQKETSENSPYSKQEDPVSINMPPDREIPSAHTSDSTPDAKILQGREKTFKMPSSDSSNKPGCSGDLYPSLKIFHSEPRHNDDYLSPEEEAELKEEAAKYRNPDRPPLVTGPPLLSCPLPYHFQMPAFTYASPPTAHALGDSYPHGGVLSPKELTIQIQKLREAIQLKKKT